MSAQNPKPRNYQFDLRKPPIPPKPSPPSPRPSTPLFYVPPFSPNGMNDSDTDPPALDGTLVSSQQSILQEGPYDRTLTSTPISEGIVETVPESQPITEGGTVEPISESQQIPDGESSFSSVKTVVECNISTPKRRGKYAHETAEQRAKRLQEASASYKRVHALKVNSNPELKKREKNFKKASNKRYKVKTRALKQKAKGIVTQPSEGLTTTIAKVGSQATSSTPNPTSSGDTPPTQTNQTFSVMTALSEILREAGQVEGDKEDEFRKFIIDQIQLVIGASQSSFAQPNDSPQPNTQEVPSQSDSATVDMTTQAFNKIHQTLAVQSSQVADLNRGLRLTYNTVTRDSYAKAADRKSSQMKAPREGKSKYKAFVNSKNYEKLHSKAVYRTLVAEGIPMEDVLACDTTRSGCLVYFKNEEKCKAFVGNVMAKSGLAEKVIAKVHKPRNPTILVHDVRREILVTDLRERRELIFNAIQSNNTNLSDVNRSELVYVREYGRGNDFSSRVILAVSPRVYQIIARNGFKVQTGFSTMNRIERKPIVTQCQRCFRFGHKSSQCKSPSKVCIQCGDNNNHGQEHKCTKFQKCCNCRPSASHRPNSESCPVYQRFLRIAEENSNYGSPDMAFSPAPKCDYAHTHGGTAFSPINSPDRSLDYLNQNVSANVTSEGSPHHSSQSHEKSHLNSSAEIAQLLHTHRNVCTAPFRLKTTQQEDEFRKTMSILNNEINVNVKISEVNNSQAGSTNNPPPTTTSPDGLDSGSN